MDQFIGMLKAPPVWRAHVDAREEICVRVGLQRHACAAVELAVVVVARDDFADLREGVATFSGCGAETQKLHAGGSECRKTLGTRCIGGTHEAGIGRTIYMDGRTAAELLDRSGREFQVLASRNVLAKGGALRHAFSTMKSDFIFSVKQIIWGAEVLDVDTPFVVCAGDVFQRKDGGRLVRRSADSAKFQPGIVVQRSASFEGDLLAGQGEFLAAFEFLFDFELFGLYSENTCFVFYFVKISIKMAKMVNFD